MPHIEFPEGLPGILGPMAFRPETAKPLNELAEVLLRGSSTLSRGERELFATYVSSRNGCLSARRQVQRGGKNVGAEDVERARQFGATDLEIHDTVLIAAAFCMYNRYVDGLATWAPLEVRAYRDPAARLAREGYVASTKELAATR